MLLNWSARSSTSLSQSHWATEASSRPVGVSALYSSIFGGPTPSNARSNRLYTDGSRDSHDRMTYSSNSWGIMNSPNIRLSITSRTRSRHIWCSSLVASSIRSTS